MLTPAPLRLLVLVIAGGLVLASCGGGDGASTALTTPSTAAPTTTTTAPPAVTRADYLAEANAVCKKMNDAVAELPDPGDDPTKYADVIDASIEIISGTLVELRALTPPPDDKVELEAIWAMVDDLIDNFSAVSAAIREGDLERAQTLGEGADASQDAANAASIKFGLTVCGS